MIFPDPNTLTWRKSSFSDPNAANCAEIAHIPGGVAIRDSKNPTGPMLTFSTSTWPPAVLDRLAH
jgi:hypothetical protein